MLVGFMRIFNFMPSSYFWYCGLH